MRRVTLLSLAALVVLTVWAYGPALSAGFVYEDAVYVDRAATATDRVNPFAPRALTEWSFRANYLLDGSDPVGYHALNLAVHLLNGVLLCLVTRRLGLSDAAALVASGVFLLHPLSSQAVAYVAGRADLFAATGTLLMLTVVTGGPLRLSRLVMLALALGFACGGKEMGLTGIFLVGLYWLWIKPSWGPSRDTLAVCAAILVFVVAPDVYQRLLDGNAYAFASERNGLGYMAVQSAALWRYLGLVVWPVGLSIDHDFDLVTKGMAFLSLTALVIALYGLYRLRKALPHVAMAGFAIVVVLIPRFFIRIPEYLNEHQMYLSMIGVSLLVASVYATWAARDEPIWHVSMRYAQEQDALCVLAQAGTRAHEYVVPVASRRSIADITQRVSCWYLATDRPRSWTDVRRVVRHVERECGHRALA